VPVRADVETSVEQSKSKEVDSARQRGVAPMISVHVHQSLVIFNGCIHIAQMYWARPRPGFWSDKLQLLLPTSPDVREDVAALLNELGQLGRVSSRVSWVVGGGNDSEVGFKRSAERGGANAQGRRDWLVQHIDMKKRGRKRKTTSRRT
jgi:hypothetical protein